MCRCRRDCCSLALWYSEDKRKYVVENPELLVPLKDVTINARFQAGFIKIESDLTYVHSENERPIEAIFEFPIEKNKVLVSMVVFIDQIKQIKAQISEKNMTHHAVIPDGGALPHRQRES